MGATDLRSLDAPLRSKSGSVIEVPLLLSPTFREEARMLKLFVSVFAGAVVFFSGLPIYSQQGGYRLPDTRSLKHLTTKQTEHARDIPGKETTTDYYSSPNGTVVTVYTYMGKPVAFSTHSNTDYQGTYRLFMDLAGTGTFQAISRTPAWELPAWVRQR
jgi:hypothetical protein